MIVNVRLAEPLRSKAGARLVKLSLPSSSSSLKTVMAELIKQVPALAPDLAHPAEYLDANYTAFQNIRVVRFADQEQVQFKDGDELSIFLPLVGG